MPPTLTLTPTTELTLAFPSGLHVTFLTMRNLASSIYYLFVQQEYTCKTLKIFTIHPDEKQIYQLE
jgi:hypothetical protein